jgi:hypothetical protein
VPATLFPSHEDAQVAQVILSVIAQSIMTVVSIVFAILLMTLTLASMQFSPRILISFVRDRGTQWTLGIFLGTFSYCVAALPAARSMPHPFAPVVTVLGAMLLALVCVGWLLFFIHHISRSISVNHIVDRIARETELVIDELMPHFARGLLPPGAGPAGAGRARVPDPERGLRLHPLHRYAAAGGVRTDAPTAPARHPTGRPLRASRRAPADGLPAREDRPRPGRGTDRGVRHRPDAHAAAGRRVRCHPDR